MSERSNKSAIQQTYVSGVSPPEPSAPPTNNISIPDVIPAVETTIYRDPKTVIRIRPARTTDGIYLTMYQRLTDETQHLTPELASNWRDETFDTSPNTVSALSETTYNRYVESINHLTDRFGLSIVHPKDGHGVCHRRHDSLGKDGIVSFETQLR